MAKKIRFPLKLAGGTEVRTLEELREHFDMEAVLEYYKNGKLLTWLEDRYLEGEAEAVRTLDESAADFQRQLCAVFQVEYTGDDVDLGEIERRQERLKRLRTITDDAEFIQNIDRVAFDQEELADLLDDGQTKIYLCGDRFTVPASRKGVAYMGIKNPAVHIRGNVPEKLEDLGIEFVGVECDNLPKTPVEPVPSPLQTDLCGLLEDIVRHKIHLLFETDHFYLYRRGYEETAEWYCCEIATGKEVLLSGEIAKTLKNAKIDSQSATCERLKIFGDQIAYRDYSDCWCSVDLETQTLHKYLGICHEDKQLAFSQNYWAVFSENRNEECVEIYNGRDTSHQVHRISSVIMGGVTIDKEVISALSKLHFQSPSYIRFFDDKLYFAISENIANPFGILAMTLGTQSPKGQIVCFDPCVGSWNMFDTETGFGPIAKSKNYLYLVRKDNSGTTVFAVLDLQSKVVKRLAEGRFDIKQISKQYLLYATVPYSVDSQYFVIELASCKVKPLPALLGSSAYKSSKLFLAGTTLYCVPFSKPALKCDLTLESPEYVELDT